jgi:hypothetical protein
MAMTVLEQTEYNALIVERDELQVMVANLMAERDDLRQDLETERIQRIHGPQYLDFD